MFCNFVDQLDEAPTDDQFDEDDVSVQLADPFNTPARVKEEYTVEDPMWDVEVVDNWTEKVAEEFSDDPLVAKYYHQMIAKVEEIKEFCANEGEKWQSIYRDDKTGLKIDGNLHKPNNCSTLRSQGWVPYSAIDIWRCIHYNPLRKKWDGNVERYETFAKLGPGLYNVLNRGKRVGIVWPREFIMNCFTYAQSDGTIFIVYTSNEDLYEEHPVDKGVLRGECPISGWIIKPDENDPNRSYCQLLIDVALGNLIPQFVIRQTFKDAGLQLARIQENIPLMKATVGKSSS